MNGETLTGNEDAAAFFAKFDVLHSIRSETTKLCDLTSNLKELLAKLSVEKQTLTEFKSEIDVLLSEKLKHVEILRQIHSDINMMEVVMKQSQDEHASTTNLVRAMFKEYESQKSTVNGLRQETQLPVLSDPDLEYIDTETTKLIGTQSKQQKSKQTQIIKSQAKSNKVPAPLVSGPAKRTRMTSESQQPNMPPMKQCPTCQQHIHRNAPICPLCKAKLRSRNPKKPRK